MLHFYRTSITTIVSHHTAILRQGQGTPMARHWAGTWPWEQLTVTVIDKGRRCPKYKCSRLEMSSVLCSVTFGASSLLLAWALCFKGLFWVLALLPDGGICLQSAFRCREGYR